MQQLILISKIVHIAAGTLALLSGLLAIVFRNKVKTHRPFGRIYFWAMTIIFFTATYISVVKVNIFLFCVGFFTYYSCLTAFRSLKLKQLHKGQKVPAFDWAVELFFGAMHVGFVIFGALLLRGENASFGIISLVFGVIGLWSNYSNVQRLRKNLRYKNYWLLAHIGGMLGSYIGAITAFLVNNNKWIHAPNLIVWLGPTAFLVPLIFFEIKKHKAKAGKFELRAAEKEN
jgi:hypothetical protein